MTFFENTRKEKTRKGIRSTRGGVGNCFVFALSVFDVLPDPYN